MIAMWRAKYRDGSVFLGRSTLDLDRSKLVGFEVMWGIDYDELSTFSVPVPEGLRLVYRRRGGVSSDPSVMMDHVLVALESGDRSFVKLWVLHCDRGFPEHFERDEWGGPNLWAPTLKPQEV